MGEQVESVSRGALLLEGIPLEIHPVDVHLRAEPEGVPHYPVSGTHLQAGQVAVHAAIYGCNSEHTTIEARSVTRHGAEDLREHTVHHVALHERIIRRIRCICSEHVNVLPQILAQVFIHDRKKKEEFLIDAFL